MAKSGMPSHLLELATGVITNIRPEDVAGKAAITAQNVDGFAQFRGLGKLPGSSVLNPSATAGSIRSVHFFEFFDLDRSSKRACIINTLDGGTAGRLKKIDVNTGAITTLLDDLGLEAFSAAEALAGATMNHRLHLSSPNQLGSNVPTGGRKFDGTRVTNWGALAPGQDSDTVEALDNAAAWATTGSTPIAPALATNTTNKIRGAASVGVTMNSNQTLARITRGPFGATNYDPNASTLIRVWLFIPSGGLQQLTATGVEVTFTAAAGTSTFRFDRGALVPGWNLLSMDSDTPSSTTGAGAGALGAITNVTLDINLDGTSVPTTQWAWNFMHNLEEGTVTAATSASGASGFDGATDAAPKTFRFRITFLTEYGLETNAGPVSNSVTTSASNNDIALTSIPISSDPSVIARRIYASDDGGVTFGFVESIDDNVSVALPTNLKFPTAELTSAHTIGLTSPPLAGDLDLDNSPPEPFLDVVALNNRIFAIDAATRLNLFISDLGQAEAFPLVGTLQVDEPMTAIRAHPEGLLVYTSDTVFLLEGDGTSSSPFTLTLKNSELGANGPRSVGVAQGVNVTVREKQVYLVETPANPWYLNGGIQNQWDKDVSASLLADGFVVSDRARFRVLIAMKGSGGAYDQLWCYQHTTQAVSDATQFEGGIDPQDLRNGSWFKITLPGTITPLCGVAGERASEVPELWIGTNEGRVHYFQDPTTTNWFTESGSVAVSATWESAALPLGFGPVGRGTPRYLEFNYSNILPTGAPAAAPVTWNVTVTTLTAADGAVLDSVTFPVTFPVGNSSPVVTVPQLPRLGSWCRVKLENANLSENGFFRSVRLYYVPRTSFVGVRTQ